MSAQHVHATEAQLVELALAGRLPECESCRARAQELASFFDACRSSLELGPEASPAEAGRLAEFADGVLARTTREDLGWRGDLRLVGRFVGTRLRSSRALRFAAASVAVHLLVLPVLAWMALREVRQERILSITIEQAREQTLPAVPMEPELLVEAPDPGPDPELVDVHEQVPAPVALEADESLRIAGRDRRSLRAAGAPGAGSSPADETTLAQLLRARSLGLAGGGSAAELPRATAGLERALLAEVLLDAWLFDGQPSPRLAAVLRELGGDPAVSLAERGLELLALDRARSYGLLDADGLTRWAALARALRSTSAPETRSPWSAWAAQLGACLATRSPGERAAAEAWASWAR